MSHLSAAALIDDPDGLAFLQAVIGTGPDANRVLTMRSACPGLDLSIDHLVDHATGQPTTGVLAGDADGWRDLQPA